MKTSFIILGLIHFVPGIWSASLNDVTTVIPDKSEEFLKNNEIQENNFSSEGSDNENKETLPENSDCSLDETEKQQGLITTYRMIKLGDEEIGRHINDSKSTILVLGNAGAGKTTFTQFMAGDNSNLVSKEVLQDLDEYTIEDGVKIGTSVTESFTLYPEQISIDSSTSITDTPGFSDTRSPKHEVVATYVMKKYFKNIKNVKIVLLVTFNSVQYGVYKDDFINLLQNINNFIKDIDKYKDGLVLIATKVPNRYKVTNNNFTLISDEKIISSVAEFLFKVQISMEEKLKNPSEEKETIFFKNAIKMLKFLQELDENGKYKRINIFRRPSEPGVLSTMVSMQQAKQSLKNTLNKINYVEVFEDDIGYALSYKAKIYLNCLLRYTNENVRKISAYSFQLLKNHYEGKLKNYVDVYNLSSELENLLEKLKTLKHDLKKSKHFSDYLSFLTKFFVNENIEFDEMQNKTILQLNDYIRSLQLFTTSDSILSTYEWVEEAKSLLDFIKENISWYNFLIKIFDHFSSYEIQKLKDNIYNSTSFNKNNPLEIILSHFDVTHFKNLYFDLLTLNNERKTDLNDVILLTLEKSVNVTCDSEGKLVLTGFYIKISIMDDKLIKTYCGENTVIKVIGVHAIHTVFIDADINAQMFRGIDMMIAAPRWEIIGKRIININGTVGKSHNNSTADNGVNFSDNGKDGLPGFPGGNGGNFLGIGLNFLNEDNLLISASGGNGGPGQNGGRGQDGEEGNSGEVKFYSSPPTEDNFDLIFNQGHILFPLTEEQIDTNRSMEASYCSGENKLYFQKGDYGNVGGHGGNGGVGGIGGKPGRILLIGENEPCKFSLINLPGISGSPGQGGEGGKSGLNGYSVLCMKTKIKQNVHGSDYCVFEDSESDFWNCVTLERVDCPEYPAANLTGLSNFTTAGIQHPPKPHNYDFSSDLYDYTLLLKNNENNKFLFKYLTRLQKHIYQKISLMKNHFWRFIVLSDSPTSTFSYNFK